MKQRNKYEQLRIAVLFGGFSSEREISLKSGEAVSNALESLGHQVFRVDVRDHQLKELDSLELDVAFIALHGTFGEDGEIQKLLQDRGIPYTGSGPVASKNAMDKLISKALFLKHGIPTPPYIVVNKDTTFPDAEHAILSFGLPVVIKPRAEGSSLGVTIVRERKKIAEALNTALAFQDTALVEKYIKGREITVGILEERALPLIEIRPRQEFFSYNAKYHDPETEYIVNPILPPERYALMQDLAVRAHRTLGCEMFSRVDMILSDEGEPFVLEVNAIPGLTLRSLVPKAARAAGIEFPQLCQRLVILAIERHHRKSSTFDKKPISYSFRKEERLCKRTDFEFVLKNGRMSRNSILKVIAVPNGLDRTRMGIITGKRFGNAVRRNRVKRVIRESFRLAKHDIPKGLDIVVIPLREKEESTLDSTRHSLVKLVTRVAAELERERN